MYRLALKHSVLYDTLVHIALVGSIGFFLGLLTKTIYPQRSKH